MRSIKEVSELTRDEANKLICEVFAEGKCIGVEEWKGHRDREDLIEVRLSNPLELTTRHKVGPPPKED